MKIQVYVCLETFREPFGVSETTKVMKVFYEEEDARTWTQQRLHYRVYEQVDIE